MSLSILSKNFKATISIDKQTEFITISLKGWPPTLAFISNIGVDRWSIRAIPKVNQVIKWNCCYCTLWREHNKRNKLDHADKTDQLTDGIILDLRCLNCEEGEEVKKSNPPPPRRNKPWPYAVMRWSCFLFYRKERLMFFFLKKFVCGSFGHS